MREGHWFVSLYNDFGDAQTVDFVAALSLEMTEGIFFSFGKNLENTYF